MKLVNLNNNLNNLNSNSISRSNFFGSCHKKSGYSLDITVG